MSISAQQNCIEQQKQLCPQKCPCADNCPLTQAMSIIGGKWKIAILCALHNDGTMRYNTLKRKIKGITNTMLANSLRELEDNGLVMREQYLEMPVRVEYSVTAACLELVPILQDLARWGTRFAAENSTP